MEGASYYAVIPAFVRYDKELKANAKLMYGEITCLSNMKGYCYASNEYFASLYGVSKRSISDWISLLVQKGYVTIELVYKDGTKEVLERRIFINDVPKEQGVWKKTSIPYGRKLPTPMEENFQDNNTSINNIKKNKDSSSSCNIFSFFESEIVGGLASANQQKAFIQLTEEFNDELLLEAMKIAKEKNKKSIKYIEAILFNWKKQNITTVSEIKPKTNVVERQSTALSVDETKHVLDQVKENNFTPEQLLAMRKKLEKGMGLC